MRKINYAFWIITIFFISLIVYAGFIEPNKLVIRQENLFLPYWQIQNFKIGVISDIHIGTKFVDLNKLEKVVNTVNSQNPDLIVFLGDLEGRYIAKLKPNEVTDILKQLKAKNGVIALLGKGDENYQIIDGKWIPYETDGVVVQKELSKIKENS